MSDAIRFTLDGAEVEARPEESLWDVSRRLGATLPHLCHRPEPGYRPDGTCRACVVEIEGERALAASCVRKPSPGMRVRTKGQRVEAARRGVFELLLADRPDQIPGVDNQVTRWAEKIGLAVSRYPARNDTPSLDRSHPAMTVDLAACIHCGLCERACREVQVNDVIGLAGRGTTTRVVFDLGDAMGTSSCVGCGECVQACPTGALRPSAAPARAERVVESVCPYCGVGCRIGVHVAGDRVVKVEGRPGPANDGRLCVKGRFGLDYVRHAHRLTVPLIRRDDAPKSADIDIDPASPWTHFREASWDEALDRAAAGLKRVRDRDGGDALAGFGSAKGSNEEAYLFQKLVRVGFGTNNVDHCTRLCHASSVAALMEGIGSAAVTAQFTEAARADVIIVIGANPAENHPVAASYIKNAVKRGAKLVVMDPRGQALARHATHMLRFRPGTDVALLNGMLNVIIAENLHDRDYVGRFVDGFDAFRDHVLRQTPEAMAAISGIDAGTIREVARLYARAKGALIFWGMGISQHTHGTDNARCLIALALLTGHVGKPGSGLHPLRGQNNVQGASDAGLLPFALPDYKRVTDASARTVFEKTWNHAIGDQPGLTVVEIVKAIDAGKIKAMYIMGENPAMSDPDAAKARAAFAKLEHLVVQDIFLTETAFHADVVLPASAWLEKEGTVTNTNRQIQMGRPALPLPGQARQDLDLIQDIARRLGLDWSYGGVRDVFGEMSGVMASRRHIDWDRLQRESTVTYPCDGPDQPGRALLFAEGFPTASRRAKLVPADFAPPEDRVDSEYPLVLTTGRQLEHWHTGALSRRSAVLDAIEPEAVVAMAPADADRLRLRPGDLARVTTRRGAIDLKVRPDAALPPGLIFIPFCYAEAAANRLTSSRLDPFGKIPEFKFSAAKVERRPDFS
ncbi:MAG: formate dehydrogenase subunit alpha [Alphaproteobacteria bacterium]|nr:formate dehydrogenase subunit alpha [Alphaproteobacteria bacterium]